jgi:hypothetical protein
VLSHLLSFRRGRERATTARAGPFLLLVPGWLLLATAKQRKRIGVRLHFAQMESDPNSQTPMSTGSESVQFATTNFPFEPRSYVP